MFNKKYVDVNIGVHICNQTAENMFSKMNDIQYLTKDGIIKVDIERWKIAQKYENKTWMIQGLEGNDDHNVKNVEMLNNFKDLEGLSFGSAIELGCGPFTNMRLFLNSFPDIKEVVLVDPLLSSYLNHPNCSYKNAIMNNRKIEIFSLPIENLNIDKKYDVVMMINVLEHCYDVNIILNKVVSLMKKGTIFIFSDMMLDFSEIDRMTRSVWDAGHPIRISTEYMNRFFDLFETIYRKDNQLILNQDMVGGNHEATWFYFIGKCK